MKKRFVFAMVAALALQGSSVMASEIEETIPASGPMQSTISFGMTMDDMVLFDAGIGIQAADSIASISVAGSTIMTGAELTFGAGDVLRVDSDNLYVNTTALSNIVEDENIAMQIGAMIGMLQVEGDWVALPIPEKIKEGQTGEPLAFDDEELVNAMMELMMPYMPVTDEENGTMTIHIDSAMLIESAAGMDQIMADNPQLGAMAAASESKPSEIFAEYIQAAAEGYSMGDPSVTTEEAAEMFAELLDASAEQSSPVGTTISVEEAVSEVFAGSEFSADIVIGEEITADITVDGETVNTEVIPSETGFDITMKAGDEELASGSLEMTEDGGAVCTLTNAEGSTIKSEATLTENGIAISASMDDEELFTAAVGSETTENGSTFNMSLAMNEAGSQMVVTVDGSMEAAEGLELEAPEAVDGLELVKNMAYLFGSMNAMEMETEM